MDRRLFSQLLAAAALAPKSIGAAFAQQKLTPIRIGTLGIADNAPFLLADKLGYYREEGLEATISTSPGGAAWIPALIAGKVDIVHSNIVSNLLARSQGYEVMIVVNNSNCRSTPPDPARVVVMTDAPIKRPKDLEGKRVAVNNLNNIVWLSVRNMVEKDGGDPNKVRYLEIPFPNMLDALQKGGVDAMANVEPFSTIAEGTGKTRVLGYFYHHVQPGVEIAENIAMASWVKANPETVEKFARAFRKAVAYMNANMKQVLLQYTKLSPELADKIAMNQLTAKSDPNSIKVWEDLMLKHGLLKQRVGVENMIYKTALE